VDFVPYRGIIEGLESISYNRLKERFLGFQAQVNNRARSLAGKSFLRAEMVSRDTAGPFTGWHQEPPLEKHDLVL